MKKNLKILGHRGYSSRYPENTLLAFKKAFENNAHGIECDLQKSKDNKYIVIHDDKIDRVTNKKGSINQLTLKQLKTCTINETEKILELSELLTIIPEDKVINIELKEETIKEEDCPFILNTFLKIFNKENLLISSFSDRLLYFFKKNQITIGFLIGEKYKKLGAFKLLKVLFKLKPDYVNLPVLMFKELGDTVSNIFIFFLKIFKRKILFWVINTEQELKRVLKFSDIIITDNPEFIYKTINKFYYKK